jgi:hypothetical protein
MDNQIAFLKARYDYLLSQKFELDSLIETILVNETPCNKHFHIYMLIRNELLEVDAKRTAIANSKEIIPDNPVTVKKAKAFADFAGHKQVFYIFLKANRGQKFVITEYISEYSLKKIHNISWTRLKRIETDTEIHYYTRKAFEIAEKCNFRLPE